MRSKGTFRFWISIKRTPMSTLALHRKKCALPSFEVSSLISAASTAAGRISRPRKLRCESATADSKTQPPIADPTSMVSGRVGSLNASPSQSSPRVIGFCDSLESGFRCCRMRLLRRAAGERCFGAKFNSVAASFAAAGAATSSGAPRPERKRAEARRCAGAAARKAQQPPTKASCRIRRMQRRREPTCDARRSPVAPTDSAGT
mmetsp:Transcript_11749/g.39229  ORF Transcript_11749/g.39229 Transcript_11749/m.39229 type:complete len:204 (+) Transcript_11749:453-1064(+)